MKTREQLHLLFAPTSRKAFALLSVLAVTTPFLFADTQVVTTHLDQDSDPPGAELSLREAIREAGDEASTITFDPSMADEVIFLNNETLEIRDSDSSDGVSAPLTIDASALDEPIIISARYLTGETDAIDVISRSLILKNVIIEEAPRYGILSAWFDSNDVTLEDVTLRYCGNCGINFATNNLTMNRCEVYGNGTEKKTGDAAGQGIRFYFGRNFEATACSVYQNFGGGIRVSGTSESRFDTATISNCTVAENGASKGVSEAMGIFTEGSMAMVISDCTIVDNLGGGVSGGDTLGLISNIIARNWDETNLALSNIIDNPLSRIDSLGYNLTDSSPASLDHPSDIKNTDPKLSRLGYFGGPMLTCFPLNGSPAIGAGNPNHANVFFGGLQDGRGFDRNASRSGVPNSNIRDIGAVEAANAISYNVTSTGFDGSGTLDTMINAQGTAHRRITFSPSLSGQTIAVNSLELGSGAHIDFDASNLDEPLILQAPANNRGFWLRDNATASFINCEFQTEGTSSEPALFVNQGSKVGLSQCVYQDNERTLLSFSTNSGMRTRTHLNECMFANNVRTTSPIISGLISAPTLQIWNSTFDSNESKAGESNAAILLSGNFRNVCELRNCTFDQTTGAGLSINGSRLRANYCTFAEHSGAAAIILRPLVGSRIRNSLFYQNTNPNSPTISDDIQNTGGGVGLDFGGNWSTSSAAYYVTFNDFELAPLADYGGYCQTRPLLEGTTLSEANEDSVRRSYDAHFEPVPIGRLPTPGAVAMPVVVVSGPSEVGLTLLSAEPGEFQVEVTADPSLTLRFYGGDDLDSLSPLGESFSTSSTNPEPQTVTSPTTLSGRYFLQVIEE